MKRTVTLSLLLLIAGNGLIVMPVHANLKDAQVTVGIICLVLVGRSLLKASGNIIDLYNTTQQLFHLKRNLPSQVLANPDSDHHQRISVAKNHIKKTKAELAYEAAIAIPLTALGAYLLKKG